MRALALLLLLVGLHSNTLAQLPVQADPDHTRLLASADPQLAANKRLVYDFWREVLEARRLDRAAHYLHPDYKQHNPLVPTGLAGFLQAFGAGKPEPRELQARISAPLVSIVAERDLVVLSFVAERPDPKDPTQRYTTTWFDMFRVENGKITEHWDPALKR